MNKKFFLTFASLLFFVNLSLYGQEESDLKKIILNKKNTLPTNWVNKIQDQGSWEFQKEVSVKRKRVKDIKYPNTNGKVFNFEGSGVEIAPFHYKVNQDEYTDLEIVYHLANKTIVISTDVQYGKQTRNQKTVYKVINLTKEYLILEEIKDTYCFDFSSGRGLTKEECKAKRQSEPERLFGGRSIDISFGKPGKRRLVLKAKK